MNASRSEPRLSGELINSRPLSRNDFTMSGEESWNDRRTLEKMGTVTNFVPPVQTVTVPDFMTLSSLT